MRVPRQPISISGNDTVICQPTGSKTPIMATIWSAEWHTGYGQWLFNEGDDQFYESQITHWFDTKKGKWRKYGL